MLNNNYSNAKNTIQNLRILWILILFYCVAMIFSNWFDIRQIKLPLIGLETDAGTLIFPFTFIISSIITEVYGYKNARWAIWCGLIFNIFGLLFGQLIYQFDSPFQENKDVFDVLIKKNSLIIIASIISYLIAEPINSYIISKSKIKFTKFLQTRFIVSNFISSFLDSACFSIIVFSLELKFNELLTFFLNLWLIKFFIGFVLVYFSTKISKILKIYEKIDIFDHRTSFNVFSFDTNYSQLDNFYSKSDYDLKIDTNYSIKINLKYNELITIWKLIEIQNNNFYKSLDKFLKTTEFSQNFCLINHTNHTVCGYARIITDYTKYASICEVLIDEKIEDKSLENKFIAKLLSHKTLKQLTVFKINNNQNKQVNMEVLLSPQQPLINDANINEIKIMEKQVN